MTPRQSRGPASPATVNRLLRVTTLTALALFPLGAILFSRDSPAPGISVREAAGLAATLSVLGLYAFGVATNGLRPVVEPTETLDERELSVGLTAFFMGLLSPQAFVAWSARPLIDADDDPMESTNG